MDEILPHRPKPRFQSVPRAFKSSPRRDPLRSQSPYSRLEALTSFPSRTSRHRSPYSRPQLPSNKPVSDSLSTSKPRPLPRYIPTDDLDDLNCVCTPSTLHPSEATLDLDESLLQYYQNEVNRVCFPSIPTGEQVDTAPERTDTPTSQRKNRGKGGNWSVNKRVSRLPPIGKGKVYHFTRTEIGK